MFQVEATEGQGVGIIEKKVNISNNERIKHDRIKHERIATLLNDTETRTTKHEHLDALLLDNVVEPILPSQ